MRNRRPIQHPQCDVTQAVLTIIELGQLGNARNAKLELLRSRQDNKVLREMFRLTYDWETTFGISAPKKLPVPSKAPGFSSAAEEWEAFKALAAQMAVREVKGNDARDRLNTLLSDCCMPQSDIFRKIVDRDLKVRVTASTIEKIWPGAIRQFKVQLAKSLDDCKKKVVFPVGIEPKYDGMRAIIVVSNGKGAAYSRAGHELPNVQFIADYIAARTLSSGVFDGELFGTSWNDTLKYVKTTKNLTPEKLAYLHEHVKFYVFDQMTLEAFYACECTNPYRLRRRILVDWFGMYMEEDGPVKLVPLHYAHNFDEIDTLYDKLLLEGYEGVMVKQLDAPYKGKRTNGWLKYKPFVSIDCVIVDTLPGRVNTRLENTLGKFTVEHEGVQFNVGSGFSDEDRDAFWAIRDELPGRYVEVKVNKDFGKKESKVNFPVYMRMRPDKDE